MSNDTITADDVRFEPLVAEVSFRTDPQSGLFTGYARTEAWNTPEPDGITLDTALRFTGLDPESWEVSHVTVHLWDDPACGSVIAYELTIAEIDFVQEPQEPIRERMGEDPTL